MKFAAVAVAALAAVSTADAALASARCVGEAYLAWISNDVDPGLACFTATGFSGAGYPFPSQETAGKFCSNSACRTLLDGVVAARPAEGDCTVQQLQADGSRVKINFYENIASVFSGVCSKSTLPPTPTTTAPPPTPTPTTTAPPPTTTAPPPKPTPTVTPEPTTQRPQC